MTVLARKLRLVDYFALGFGVTVGTAWLVTMDDLLQRGGSLGAILGFAAGGLMLLPIGHVYGELVRAIPDSAGEVAYTARFFSPGISFATGWMMFLTYFLTCPFEALAAGRIAGYLFPWLNRFELYRLGGRAVYRPQIILGLTTRRTRSPEDCRRQVTLRSIAATSNVLADPALSHFHQVGVLRRSFPVRSRRFRYTCSHRQKRRCARSPATTYRSPHPSRRSSTFPTTLYLAELRYLCRFDDRSRSRN